MTETTVHREVAGWAGPPGRCGVECECGVVFDGFDTLAEAGAMLQLHIDNAEPSAQPTLIAGLLPGGLADLAIAKVRIVEILADHTVVVRTPRGWVLHLSPEPALTITPLTQSSGAASPAPDPRPAADLPLSGGGTGLFTSAGPEDIRPVSPAFQPVQPAPVADPALRGQDGGEDQ